MIKRGLWACLCLLGLSVWHTDKAWADNLSSTPLLGKKIISIDVQGNRYVEAAAVLDGLRIKVGGVFKRRDLSRDIQHLFSTGYYKNIKVSGGLEGAGIKLILHVTENPFITEYHMDGNEEVTYKDMKHRLTLKEGVLFSEEKLRKDINTIRKGYLKKGFYQLKVNAEKVILADGGMKLSMHVIEGEKTHIRQVRFIGNDTFSDATLSDKISASVSGLIPWFTNKDVIDTKKFANDAQRLIEFYQNNGYLDVSVESSQLALTPDKKSFYLTFSLHEGVVYHVSQLEVQGDMEPSREKLLEAMAMDEGQIYSVTDLRATIEALSVLVGDEGYAFNSVTPLFTRNIEDHTVAITFDVEKGREVYIERIEVEGNAKTDDGVIRREMRLDEMQRYSSTAMKQSKKSLNRLSLFKDVRISMPRGSADDRVKAKVNVEEDDTGSFGLGVGFSRVEKIMFRVKTAQKNLFGKGYNGNITADIGKVTQNFDTSITDPYFLDSNVAATLSLNKTQTNLNNSVNTNNLYTQNDFGGGMNFSVPITLAINYGIGYKYSNTNLSNIDPLASISLRSQKGKQTTSELTQVFSYDTRDRLISTTEGSNHSISFSAAGLGGSSRFWEAGAAVKSYLPFMEKFVFSAGLGARIVHGYSGKDVPIYRRYSLGGVGSVRGFDFYGISVRDPVTGDPVGGDKKMTGSLNVYFPFPYVQTSGLRGVVFTDIGTTWGSENQTGASVALSTSIIRVSSGVGVEWSSPVGPLTLSWAKAIRKQPNDILRVFEFGLGRTF